MIVPTLDHWGLLIVNLQCNLDSLLRPMGIEQSMFMHQEKGKKYPTKFGSVTPSGVSKDHLRLPCLLNLKNNRSLFW